MTLIDFRKSLRRLTPAQSLVAGFTLIILAGAVLLTLPLSSSAGVSQSFVDALFTSVSAVTTTGLVVVDTGSYYSLFGQAVILVLFQIGGLGYMTFIVVFAYILGRKPSLMSGMTLQESFSGLSMGEIKGFIKSVILYTVFFEFAGAILLALYWMREFAPLESLYYAIFHSVSAFCTAGFGLFRDSLASYRNDPVVNPVISILCFAGGIGFFVLHDLRRLFDRNPGETRRKGLSLHSRLALVSSLALAAGGTAVIFAAGGDVTSLPAGDRLTTSLFQALSASTTTGFSTIETRSMGSTGLFATTILMFIGASPGGSGGGIKTTTFGLTVIFLRALLRGRREVVVFKREIPPETMNRAFAIGLAALLLVLFDTLLLTVTEEAPFLYILFESVSAFGTVGLSTGITHELSAAGKLVISLTMLIGRLGPLAIGFSLVSRKKPAAFRYTEGKVYVG